jgi:hypothetical protein
MFVHLQLAKLAIRDDGKYNCEVLVRGYDESILGAYCIFTKNQKIVLILEESDLGEDLCKLMYNVRKHVHDNPNIIEQLKLIEQVDSLQVDEEEEQSPEGMQASVFKNRRFI